MFLRQDELSVSPGIADKAAEPRNDLVPLADAARHYIEVMNPLPVIPSQAQVDTTARELARRLPIFRLADGSAATSRGALDSYIALKRYTYGV